MGLFNSKTKQVENYEEFTSKQLAPFPPTGRVGRQDDAANDASSTTAFITIGAALVLANVLLAIALKPERPKLENTSMCGVPSEGEAECYFDCVSIFNQLDPSVRLIKNLDCLDDCYTAPRRGSRNDDEEYNELGRKCIKSLVKDVREYGVCGVYPDLLEVRSVYSMNASCYVTISCLEPYDPIIIYGTVSKETEEALNGTECKQFILQQPPIILNTVIELIRTACTREVSKEYVRIRVQYNETTCGCTKEQFANVTGSFLDFTCDYEDYDPQYYYEDYRINNPTTTGYAPIEFEFVGKNVQLEIKYQYQHTLNRYSWICSLRSTDVSKEHLCAVTLLSVPPKPTVIVGAAHCTFLCKNGKQRVPSCCCRTGSTACNDRSRCGRNPEVVEMRASDVQILCNEWQTGTDQPDEEETNNIILDIWEIVKHPDFDTEEGPIAGNDIAIFKVHDKKIRNQQLNPVCFAPKEPEEYGIHAGWAEPPTRDFITTYAPAYEPFYTDFYKAWHYRMDIDKCEDPKFSTFGKLKYPSNTAYPAGTICAKDFAKSACFTSGESGSPLMVQENPPVKEKYYTLGLLSFVKGRGCDIYSNNPSAYTKLACFLPWIAKQYGMDYEPEGKEEDTQCTQGTPATISKDSNCLENETKEKCQNTPSSLQEFYRGERDCIFPFYYNGRKYNECIVFSQNDFVYPAFRCPIYDIITKVNGTNSYALGIIDNKYKTKKCSSFACQIFQTPSYCPVNTTDQNSALTPFDQSCTKAQRRAPFSVCKNNCPGVGTLGVIGAGALTYVATALGGQYLLTMLGIGLLPVIGGGAGMLMLNQNCCPNCPRTATLCCTGPGRRQRCRLQEVSQGRLRCPSRC